MTLGNHDHDAAIGPYKIYAASSGQFYLPHWYYSFEAGTEKNRAAFFSVLSSPLMTSAINMTFKTGKEAGL